MGSGHALQALVNARNNRILSQKHRTKYTKMKEAVSKIDSKYHDFKDRSSLSQEQMQVLKKKIKKEIVLQKQKTLFISATITAFIIIGSYFVIRFLYQYFWG